ncbi:hypothetical protein HY570_00455 [Candidatus Micrarchaeota archaeon]|nr:hypothetical protein [Candidatus Micrarchaeota archaeon]
MVKVISLSEEAYRLLKQFKKKDRSFSDIIVSQLTSGKKVKTRKLEDLIKWVESLQSKASKNKIRIDIDRVAYGVSR